jgi:hypothetical protein
MKQVIKERLERYTDLSDALIDEITRQVIISLDVSGESNTVVMDEYNYETELEKAADQGFDTGRRVGFMVAMDMLMDDIDGLEISDIEAWCHEKKSTYLDEV